MSHRETALTLMMALAMPGAVQALGLGEIHLDSALNEPLSAHIEIVGATAEDLAEITASIANRETFQQHGVDRPAFLSTAAFKVARDAEGRPVLTIRSTDACTEPLVNILVDLHWRGGELIRQYTLLLDLPGLHPATQVAEAAVGSPASDAVPVSVPPVSPSTAAVSRAERKTVKVGAKATLRGLAWRVGARSEADIKRMMFAIFRANSNAFDGNINRLRLGALLTIPSTHDVEAISMAEVDDEIDAQMQAWHGSDHPQGQALPAAANLAAPVSPPRESESASPAEMALDRRVRQLEKGLSELQGQVDREHVELLQARALLAERTPDDALQVQSGFAIGPYIAALFGLAAAACGIYAWRRRAWQRRALEPVPTPAPATPAAPAVVAEAALGAPIGVPPRAVVVESRSVGVEPQEPVRGTQDAKSATQLYAKAGERQWIAEALAHRSEAVAPEPAEAPSSGDVVDIDGLEASYLQSAGGAPQEMFELGESDETARLPGTSMLDVNDANADTMPVETARLAAVLEPTRELRAADGALPASEPAAQASEHAYAGLDLDLTVQHVHLPSALNENVGFKERRTNPVDALKNAVEREPHRRDLRMKLLETYYAAAVTNRKEFLDLVKRIALERTSMDDGEWDKIAWMGRQVASDDDLFAPSITPSDERDLLDCA